MDDNLNSWLDYNEYLQKIFQFISLLALFVKTWTILNLAKGARRYVIH